MDPNQQQPVPTVYQPQNPQPELAPPPPPPPASQPSFVAPDNQTSLGQNQPTQSFQPPADQGQSPQSSQPFQPVPPQQVMSPALPPHRRKHLLPIIGVAAVVVLGLGTLAAIAAHNKSKDNATTSGSNAAASSSNQDAKFHEAAAQSLDDYSAVCNGTHITNATSYQTAANPHPIQLFQPSLTSGDFIQGSVYFQDAGWQPDYKNPSSVQLVGCMTRKSVGATAGKQCQLQDSDKKTVTLPLYPVIYNLAIYEAKTGKKLADKEISAPVADCPYLVSYDPNDPKLYADPNDGAVTEAVRPFVVK